MGDLETLQNIILIFMWLAAVATTIFPILYAFSPWNSTHIGRSLMLLSISLALAIDLTLASRYGIPSSVELRLWFYVFVFGMIAISSSCLTYFLWKTNYQHAIHFKRSNNG